jgi:hypothetical protein
MIDSDEQDANRYLSVAPGGNSKSKQSRLSAIITIDNNYWFGARSISEFPINRDK